MAYILAFANQKGGVGKTTSAVNVAACLSQQGQRVLLVDLDPQGNATTGLGQDTQDIYQSVYRILFEPDAIHQIIQSTDFTNLSILPSSIDLAGAEVELFNKEEREFALKKALSFVDADYDVIVIDCPPALGFLTINALTAASGVCVPLQCEYYALEGISHLMKTIQTIRHNFNPQLQIMGIALTMYDRRAKLTTMVEDDVRGYFKDIVFQTKIPRNIRLSEAPSHGLPVINYDNDASGSHAYRALSSEILTRIQG